MRVRVPPILLQYQHIKNIKMARNLFVDVETFSSIDLRKSGAYKYIESDDFEILLIGYALDNGPVTVLDLAQGESISEEFEEALLDPKCVKVAHNAVFERLSFRRIGYEVPAGQWYCTLVKAAYCGLPLSLDAVSERLDLVNKKLDTGKSLIKYFSCPCRPTKINGMRSRNRPWHDPEKWEMYKEYNKYDVLSEREIFQKLSTYEIPDIEREMYVLDQNINDRGILVDIELAKSAIAVDTEYTELLTNRAKELTGLRNPNSPTQIRKWIKQTTGHVVTSLSKEVMPDLLEEFKDYPAIIEMLGIRRKLSKTSIRKYHAMLNCAMNDNRCRGLFQFYGANRTGRWAGRLLQLQNLSKNHTSHVEMPREIVRARDWEALEMMYGNVPDVLSQLVRTALIAPKGKTFAVADFSAIEARVISWLADEKWRMEVFEGDGKIYEATGSKMFNVPIKLITKGSALRDKSKIAELALGYEGSVGALKRMGGERMGLSDVEMRDLVRKWRSANPSIVRMWNEIDRASKEAVLYRRPVLCTSKRLIFDCDGKFLTVKLPSGRKLFYADPTFRDKRIGRAIMPTRVLCYGGVIQKTNQWGLIDTYGGKLTENIVQAIARDLLGYSMLNMQKEGFKITMHVHDEAIAEIPFENAEEHYNKMVEAMETVPDWASGFPLKADGYITPFYLKD